MWYREPMAPSPTAVAAQACCGVIFARLAGERGVHAETAVAAAARMAGTFLLLSLGLPLDKLPSGAPVFSDAANEKGPALVSLYAGTLRALGIDADPQRAGAAAASAELLLSLLDTQRLLDGPLAAVAREHGLSYAEAAEACAVAAAVITQKCSAVLAPDVSSGIAGYGFVEGSKTVPYMPSAEAG